MVFAFVKDPFQGWTFERSWALFRELDPVFFAAADDDGTESALDLVSSSWRANMHLLPLPPTADVGVAVDADVGVAAGAGVGSGLQHLHLG